MGFFDIFRRNKTLDLENLKEQVAGTAFDKLLEEGKDYTVFDRKNGAILVKKIVRWQYFKKSGETIDAMFSIETDKGVFCFQMKKNDIYLVPTDLVEPIYPDLFPKDE